MARTEIAAARVDSRLIDQVRERHGLDGEPLSVVVRYALAVAGGADPERVARLPLGRRPNTPRAAAA